MTPRSGHGESTRQRVICVDPDDCENAPLERNNTVANHSHEVVESVDLDALVGEQSIECFG